MITDAKMSAEMMKTAKSIKHCMMIATDAKGKNYLIDTSIKQGTPNVKVEYLARTMLDSFARAFAER
ncbi:MAG: hypothetical protein EOR74_24595 [Mesorhizobium sp.]|nr:MAG: hypothetical protein EOR74_24595 [Mesorhizobium sp.]